MANQQASHKQPSQWEDNVEGLFSRTEEEGRRFEGLSDTALVGIVASPQGNIVREAAAVEMQRREIHAIREFNAEAERQAARFKTITVLLTWLTVAAIVFGGIQATAALVQFYRWYRG